MKKYILLFSVFFLLACSQQNDVWEDETNDSRSGSEQDSKPGTFVPPTIDVDTTQVIIDDKVEISF